MTKLLDLGLVSEETKATFTNGTIQDAKVQCSNSPIKFYRGFNNGNKELDPVNSCVLTD